VGTPGMTGLRLGEVTMMGLTLPALAMACKAMMASI
jgi:hypothetical protein